MEFNSELLSCTKYKQLQPNIKLQGKLFQKNQDKQLVKLSLESKQAIDELFYSFSCLSVVIMRKMSED